MYLHGIRETSDVDLLFDDKISSSDVLNFSNFDVKHNDRWTKIFGFETISDLLFDPTRTGYCFGLKYVDLITIQEMKLKKIEISKDDEKNLRDVKLIQEHIKR